MPNLVGIGNSQVPTNAMLGGLAYQDSVGEIVIDKIKARASDTAVDIFVYDTRKDSDGGAWRHRTQNTSWYNEGASADRGARKEFPAVAIIVAENDILTIYDGDDPNLPMWMIFRAGGNNGHRMIGRTNENTNCVSMLNGLMCVGRTSFGLHMINFIADRARFKEAGYDTPYISPIGTNRNDGNAWLGANVDGNDLVNDTVNDVAMTVLPNAPIDASTGLPVPTIAVTTPGGTNIINDDGTVTLYTNIATKHVDLHPTGYMLEGVTGAVNDNYSLFEIGNTTRVTSYGHRVGQHGYNTYLNHATGETIFEGSSNKIAIAQIYGILRIEENFNDYVSGLHNRTTSSYNTGWMVGDIKGAFLSDTVTEKDGVNYALSAQYDGTNRLTSQTYSNGATSWQMVDNAGNNNGYVVIAFKGLTVGQKYKISMTWDNNATLDSGYNHRVAHLNATADENDTIFDHWNKTNAGSEILTGVFTAQSTDNDDLVIYANAITLNVSHFKIEETDDINGRELVTNPGPFTSTTGWVAANVGWSVSDSNNRLVINSGSQTGSYFGASQTLNLANGKKYVLVVSIHSQTKTAVIRLTADGNYFTSTGLGTGVHSFYFTANQASHSIFIGSDVGGSNREQQINYVNIREIEEDRSANNKGLQIHGTLTKSAIATGAELVSYGNFSLSNYLQQPYTSDMNLSDGAFTIMAWIYPTNNDLGGIISRGSGGVYGPYALNYSSKDITFVSSADWNESNDGGSWGTLIQTSGDFCQHNKWSQVVVTKSGSTAKVFINGIRRAQDTSAVDPKAPTSNFIPTMIGIEREGVSGNINRPFPGRLALIRASNTAATEEQVYKMYNDEKCLFHENAKCTFHGTSDNVEALAYDDTTNVLHIGTSSGRSEFQGLNRINNTTTAVTTAISVSDEFVAEQ